MNTFQQASQRLRSSLDSQSLELACVNFINTYGLPAYSEVMERVQDVISLDRATLK